jgi:hypothetical protein
MKNPAGNGGVTSSLGRVFRDHQKQAEHVVIERRDDRDPNSDSDGVSRQCQGTPQGF